VRLEICQEFKESRGLGCCWRKQREGRQMRFGLHSFKDQVCLTLEPIQTEPEHMIPWLLEATPGGLLCRRPIYYFLILILRASLSVPLNWKYLMLPFIRFLRMTSTQLYAPASPSSHTPPYVLLQHLPSVQHFSCR